MRLEILISLAVCITLARSKSVIQSNFRIFNGNDAARGQFPYQASIRDRYGNTHHCGAAIINERFLLTAAHCTKFDYANPEKVSVVVGALDPSKEGVTMEVDKIIPHEGFDPWSLKNDIALIRTTKDIEFNDQTKPIPLPNEDAVDDGKPLTIAGWGKTGENTRPDKLQNIEVKQMDNRECEKKFNTQNSIFDDDFGSFNVYSSNVCAIGEDKKSTCPGDSGII